MQEVLLIKVGELALKGLNRQTFEGQLIRNIRQKLGRELPCEVSISQSTICLAPQRSEISIDKYLQKTQKVFGIANISVAHVCEKDIEKIKKCAANFLDQTETAGKTFKVAAKRSDKKFPLSSPEIAREVGAAVLQAFPNLRANMENPDIMLSVEVRSSCAYIHTQPASGALGLPVGTGGRAAVLISGGIDSPVAAWLMASRGVELLAVHFASPPYTGARAEQKVRDLLGKISEFSGKILLSVVNLTKVQEKIRNKCPEALLTIILRRSMMRISSEIAAKQRCKALITGESLGQVASQTMSAIACTDESARLPVFRPLIGLDKDQIIRIARRIGTYETSILPFEDCCTVFTPRHPKTQPNLQEVLEAEAAADLGALELQAIESVKQSVICEY